MPFSGFEVLSIKMRMLLIVLLAAVALPAQSRKWLIAIVGISHESNSFNVHPTRLEDFRQSPDVAREDFTREAAETNNDPGTGPARGAASLGHALGYARPAHAARTGAGRCLV